MITYLGTFAASDYTRQSSDDDISGPGVKMMCKNKKGSSTITKKGKTQIGTDNQELTIILGWAAAEVDALEKEFASYIQKKTYPSGQKIKEFIQKKSINRTVTVVKSKLQHLIKLANKNQLLYVKHFLHFDTFSISRFFFQKYKIYHYKAYLVNLLVEVYRFYTLMYLLRCIHANKTFYN